MDFERKPDTPTTDYMPLSHPKGSTDQRPSYKTKAILPDALEIYKAKA
jgi:hypothetical protein